MNHNRFTTDDELRLLAGILERIKKFDLSFRKGATELREATGKNISHEGLRKIYMREMSKETPEVFGTLDEHSDKTTLGD